jgi:hypothetical protein
MLLQQYDLRTPLLPQREMLSRRAESEKGERTTSRDGDDAIYGSKSIHTSSVPKTARGTRTATSRRRSSACVRLAASLPSSYSDSAREKRGYKAASFVDLRPGPKSESAAVASSGLTQPLTSSKRPKRAFIVSEKEGSAVELSSPASTRQSTVKPSSSTRPVTSSAEACKHARKRRVRLRCDTCGEKLTQDAP